MNSEQLRQLSELLSSVNAVNGGKNQLRFCGAFVEDEKGQRIVELGVNENLELIAIRIFPQAS
jgi:hypothetical protein